MFTFFTLLSEANSGSCVEEGRPTLSPKPQHAAGSSVVDDGWGEEENTLSARTKKRRSPEQKQFIGTPLSANEVGLPGPPEQPRRSEGHFVQEAAHNSLMPDVGIHHLEPEAIQTMITRNNSKDDQDTSTDDIPGVAIVSRKGANHHGALLKLLETSCYILALACILFVPIWKVIDTSFIFREKDDPSYFDKMKEYFSSESKWPFSTPIDNGKDTYRVYFFIAPFCLGFLFLAAHDMLKSHSKPAVVSRPLFPNLIHKRMISGLNICDILLISMTVIYSVILLWVRMKRSLTRGAKKLTFLYQDSKTELDPYSWEGCEVMAKSLGVLTVTLLGWFILMPIGRRSALLHAMRIPWEVAIKYHRWLGWYTLAALMAHTVTYIAVWARANGDPAYDPEANMMRHMMVPGSCNDGSCNKDREVLHAEMMYGFASLLIMLVMSAAAFQCVRRKFFEIFFLAHQLFVVLIFFLILHYGKTPLYIMPGIIMILIDKVIGWISYVGVVDADVKCLTDDMFEIRVAKDSAAKCLPGQYVFLCVPEISILQWHPMTVTWAAKNEIALHIRACGPGTWTQQVYDKVSRARSIKVKLDGFYGADISRTYKLTKKDAVLFVAGGCGLTMPFSIVMDVCQKNLHTPVYVHWVTRTKQEYAAFQDLLQHVASRFGNVTVSVWVTLNGHTADEPGYFSCASVPASTEKHAPHHNTWRPYPSWLWSMSTHAIVTSISILVGVCGYAMVRQHEFDGDMGQTRAILVGRSLGLVFPMLLVFAFLISLVAMRLVCDHVFRRSRHQNAKERPPSITEASISTGHDDETETTEEDRFDLDTVELGNVPLIAGTGMRANFSEICRIIEMDNNCSIIETDNNNEGVAVLACGPKGLVQDVRNECNLRVSKGWIMADEEWEW